MKTLVFWQDSLQKKSGTSRFKVENKLPDNLCWIFNMLGKMNSWWNRNVEIDYQLDYSIELVYMERRVTGFFRMWSPPLLIGDQDPLLEWFLIQTFVTLVPVSKKLLATVSEKPLKSWNYCGRGENSGCTIWKRAEFDLKYREKGSVRIQRRFKVYDAGLPTCCQESESKYTGISEIISFANRYYTSFARKTCGGRNR